MARHHNCAQYGIAHRRSLLRKYARHICSRSVGHADARPHTITCMSGPALALRPRRDLTNIAVGTSEHTRVVAQ